MSTNYGVNSPEAQKLWSRTLWHEALPQTYYFKFCGSSANSLCQVVTDLSKDAGDRVRVTLRRLLTGRGVQGDDTLEGKEESLNTKTDDVFVDQVRHAVRTGGRMSEQRVPFSVREENKDGLADWHTDRADTWFFNQLCGYTAEEDTIYTGNQAAIAPDANHHFVQSGTTTSLIGATTETTIGSASVSNRFRLTSIDALITHAKTMRMNGAPVIRPITSGGNKHYVMFLHPHQVKDLRTDATAGQITWYDAQKAAMQGGRVDNNPIFTGALGIYNGVILHEAERITYGASGSATEAQVRRAVFCGAQAMINAFGRGYGSKQRMDWVEQYFDYENQLGCAAGYIGGIKKARYDGSDFATIVLSTSWTGA